MARPSEYAEATAELVCELIGQGLKLEEICAREDMPAASTIYRWLPEHPEFATRFQYARCANAHRLEDQCLAIADNVAADQPATDAEGGSRGGSYVAIQRDKLRIEIRRWLIRRMTGRRYGAGRYPEHPGAGEELPSSRKPDIEWPEAE